MKTRHDGTKVHEKLIQESIRDAHWMLSQQPDSTLEELAVEFMMVRLAIEMIPSLSGYSHVQTNPRWSYNPQKTIKNAESKLILPSTIVQFDHYLLYADQVQESSRYSSILRRLTTPTESVSRFRRHGKVCRLAGSSRNEV